MLHSAEKSLSSFRFLVIRILINFLCCSVKVCKSYCQFSWCGDCELLFPIPSGIVLASRRWDELLVLLFLLSSLANLFFQQKWYLALINIFENIAYAKTCKDKWQLRLNRRRHKFRRRRQSRLDTTRLFARFLLQRRSRLFDSSLGFPGEGWNSLRMATWNTRSLTFERYKYCESLGYDVLAITELWRTQQKYQTKNTKYTTSTPKIIQKGPRKGQKRFPDDKAAGVGILLSARAQKKLMGFDSEGERVCWVRLKGPTCNIFIVAVYMPHRGRTQPSQDDTIKDLQTVLAKVPSGDCICILGCGDYEK